MLTEQEKHVYRQFSKLNLPRHTSFPIYPLWKKNVTDENYFAALQRDLENIEEISLYVHIPFCEKLCRYCGCNKLIVSNDRRQKFDPSQNFLLGLSEELELLRPHLGKKRIKELHLGGGSPTFLSAEELNKMMEILSQYFDLDPTGNYSVEIDPRITSVSQLQVLRNWYFTRASLGIQDFDPTVQKAVGRFQSFEMIQELMKQLRSLGFQSVNFDLIYGLPFQTRSSMETTLNQVLNLNPDRIAFFRLALMPEISNWYKSFSQESIPGYEDTLFFIEQAIQKFSPIYRYIGFDHFAKPDDSLSKSLEEGNLQRNFQGMSTGKALPIIGIGPSAISFTGHTYHQNQKNYASWLKSTKGLGQLTERGLELTKLDLAFKHLIDEIYGSGSIDLKGTSQKFFGHVNHFLPFSPKMERLEKYGLVKKVSDQSFQLTSPLGQILSRVVASAVDPYLGPDDWETGLSVASGSKVG
jgi:oxygen-independent coproporphyrinogen-3 oxidase